MREEDGGNAVFQQPGDIGPGGLRHKVAQADVVFVDFQFIFFQGAQIGPVPRLQDIGIQGPGDQPDLFVPQPDQMLDGQFYALLVVTAHGGDVGIVLNIVVIQDGGNLGGLELLHPGIQQRKAQHKSRLITVVQHKHSIGGQPLEFHGEGNHLHAPSVGFRHLQKALYNVVAKLVGGLVVHVFN